MKRIFFAILLLMPCFIIQGLQNINDFEIQIKNGDSIIIINYKGTEKDIEIPNEILGLTVTDIKEKAFMKKNISSITIPDTVHYIGDSAFAYNNLTSVTISQNAIYIGSNAFSDNRIGKIIIPNSVIFIGEKAFYNNNLQEINIGTGVVHIGDSAFYGHRVSEIIIPDNVIYIGENAFVIFRNANLKITSITIGNYAKLDSKTGPVFFNTFDVFYNENGRKKGVYSYNNDRWMVSNE
jgi:hypothetical protein